MKKQIIQLFVFAVLLLVTISSVQNPYTSNYVKELKQTSTTALKMSDSLYVEIEEKAKFYEKDPQDAQVHKVWKAMPGLNGLRVDVEASYQKMKKEGKFDEKKLVFKQVPPEVTLDDLPPNPIYRGHPDKPMVAFMVNVAWGNEYLTKILQTLKDEGVSATFFLDGSWVKKNPDLTKMIVEGGHEIGNHAYSHPDLKQMTNAAIRKQLVDTNEVIKATIDQTPAWFAPPSGSYRDDVVEIAADLNMGTVLWSVDTIDWKNPEPQEMVNRVASKIHAGALVLMHPTDATASGLADLIKRIRKKEYEITNVSKLLSEERNYSFNYQEKQSKQEKQNADE